VKTFFLNHEILFVVEGVLGQSFNSTYVSDSADFFGAKGENKGGITGDRHEQEDEKVAGIQCCPRATPNKGSLARPSGTPSKDVFTSIPSGTSPLHQPQRQRSKARKQQNSNNDQLAYTFRLPFVTIHFCTPLVFVFLFS